MSGPAARKTTLYIVTAVVLIAIIAGVAYYFYAAAPAPAAPPAEEVGTIVIGVPTSTDFLYGWTAAKGVRLAAEEINEAGGVIIGGKRYNFEVVVMNTRDLEPGVPTSEALMVVEKVITERGADVLIGGPARSEAALACLALDAQYKKIHIHSTGTLTPRLNKEIANNYDKYKYTFRISHEAAGLAREAFEILSYLRDKYGFNKVYIMVQDVAHARAIGNILKSKLEEAGGWEVYGPDIYPTGATDYSTSLVRARDVGAQILFIWMDHPETSILIKQWHDLKIPALPVTGICSAMEMPTAWNETGGYIEYVIACPCNTGNAWSNYAPAMEFFNKHKERWGIEPEGYGAVSSYTAVYVFKDALERAAAKDPEAVRKYIEENTAAPDVLIKALEETDYMGPYGRIRFDPQSHQVIQSYDPDEGAVTCWFQWLNGKRVQIWPPNPEVALSEIQIPPWMAAGS